MSYKNASIPLEAGLNLIVGPNGAGKSSILLGISVVLGQAYTERARKLSDLIRWNEDQARVSLLLDNESEKGARLFPQARSDKVLLTRILKRSGDYHYLLNNKPINTADLFEGLSKAGLTPDNMLVIMHQLMVGRFGNVSPIEKLLLLEDAVGFGSREWWKARRTSDVEAWIEQIPFDETRLYVKRVMLSWDEYRRLYGGGTR